MNSRRFVGRPGLDDRIVVVEKLKKRTTISERTWPIRVDFIDQWRWDGGVTRFNPKPMTIREAKDLYRKLGKVLKGALEKGDG